MTSPRPAPTSELSASPFLRAARNRGWRHMTAFTYRCAPSMRYLRHLLKSGDLGVPRHFRSQRFLTSFGLIAASSVPNVRFGS